MNIRAEQLDDERDGRAIRDEIEECLLSEQTRPQVKMVILRPARQIWFVEQGFRQTVASLDETFDCFWRKSIRNDQEAVFSERSSLLRFEVNEIQ